MSTFWIIALSALGLFLLINIFSIIILRIAIGRKPIINLAKDKIIRKTEWGVHIPKLVEGIERFNSIPKERICRKSFDRLNLVAYYVPCVKQPESKKYVLLMHGYASCGKNDFAIAIDYYQQMGYNILLPDQRAHGESEGKYIAFGILERFDCKMWIEYLTERFGNDIQIVLGGISMGAATVLMASGLDLPDSIKCIYADCGFTEPVEELKHIMHRFLHFPSRGMIFGASIISRWLAGYDIKSCSTIEILKNAKKPIFFIHGKADKLIPYKFTEENYTACTSEKMLFLVDGAMHGTSFFTDNVGYRSKMEEFLSKYVN